MSASAATPTAALERLRAAGAVAALIPHLGSGADVLRAGAARCLGRFGDGAAAPALVTALMDEDEDVRTDAMAALERVARAEDVPALLASLEGDPVPEVKIAAIRTLARIGDPCALPRLRSLVRDRCRAEIAWDDDNGYWDDWLDVQGAAITALGQMRVAEAQGEIIAARSDEMNQALDEVVLPALARLPEGAEALIALTRDAEARTRAHAVRALGAAGAAGLDPYAARLLADPAAAVRQTAVTLCTLEPEELAGIAAEDIDARVRRAALDRLGPGHDGPMAHGLTDTSEDVRAAALGHLSAPGAAALGPDLAANLEAWGRMAGPVLATAAIGRLSEIAPERAFEVLHGIAQDADRPLPARLAAVEALGTEGSTRTVEALAGILALPGRQLRLVACEALARHAASDTPHGAAALATLIDAISQRIEPGAPAPEAEGGPDAAAPRLDGGDGRLRITPEGEIVKAEEEAAATGSTLAMLQQGREAEGGERPPSRAARRRVSVEGNGADPADLAATALRMAARLPITEVEEALCACLTAEDRDLARAAAEAASARAAMIPPSAKTVAALTEVLRGEDPIARAHACRALLHGGAAARAAVRDHVTDPDPSTRAVAVAAFAGGDDILALGALDDPAEIVALAAARGILAGGSGPLAEVAFTRCLSGARLSAAAALLAGSAAAAAEAVRLLTAETPVAEAQTIMASIEHAAERLT